MTLHLGDCLDILKTIPDDSVHSLVTDPPAGISFMGKSWDSDKGGREHWVKWMSEVMRECLRVMKPGAHGLVWALPRTSHWTATALEDAGFEVRDVITHLFGNGFPKGLDISKAIDKANGEKRLVVGEVKKTQSFGRNTATGFGGDIDRNNVMQITSAASAASAAWQGWRTALKPASEHWILVRKPCSDKTIAANVLEHGCGGINVDGCRIGTEQRTYSIDGALRTGKFFQNGANQPLKERDYQTVVGRFPANLILSHSHYCTDEQCDIECAILQLDAQSGPCKTGALTSQLRPKNKIYGSAANTYKIYGLAANTLGKPRVYTPDAATGASRFFYCAKVSLSERGEGNNHPTVKAQKLMRYLCRLITPPQGIVLDPFMGSGSTGLAAKSEGFEFIGIEKDPEYFKIAEARIG